MIHFLNIDCMEYMAMQPDNAFDLAIIDSITCLHDVSPDEYFSELRRVSKKQAINLSTNFNQRDTSFYMQMLLSHAKPGQHVFQTHVCFAPILLAADQYGCDVTGCEKSAEMFLKTYKTYQDETAQIAASLV